MSDGTMLTKPQYTIFITNGPHCSRTIRTPHGQEVFPDAISVRQKIQAALEHEDEEIFRIMVGSICLNVRNADGSFDVEPMLITPIPISLRIIDWCNESANPSGISIIGRVMEVMNYKIQLPNNYRYDPSSCIVSVGDIVQASYHLERCTGGLVPVNLAYDHQPPLINSLSEVCREYVVAGDKSCHQQRGRGVYKISSTELDAPVGFDEMMISDL